MSGPLDLKAISTYFNAEGLRIGGRRLSLRLVHLILGRETYAGRHYSNVTDSRTLRPKPRADWVEVSVPAIVDGKTFAAVEKRLRSRDPRKAKPGVSGSPHLLTGLARYAECGGAMTMANGKSGRYRYNKCSTFMRMGPTACSGRVMPMDKLEKLVTDVLRDRILSPGFLKETIAAHRQRALASVDRLFQLVAGGVLGAEDPDLKRHFLDAQAVREAAQQRLLEAQATAAPPVQEPTGLQIRELTDLTRGELKEAGTEARKAAIQLIVDKVVVDRDTVSLIRNAMKLALLATNLDGTGVLKHS